MLIESKYTINIFALSTDLSFLSLLNASQTQHPWLNLSHLSHPSGQCVKSSRKLHELNLRHFLSWKLRCRCDDSRHVTCCNATLGEHFLAGLTRKRELPEKHVSDRDRQAVSILWSQLRLHQMLKSFFPLNGYVIWIFHVIWRFLLTIFVALSAANKAESGRTCGSEEHEYKKVPWIKIPLIFRIING